MHPLQSKAVTAVGMFVLMAVFNSLRAQSIYATPYTFTALAEKTGPAGKADGTAGAPSFRWPSSVAVDTAGNVYVADHSIIRKIASNGVVTTLAGQESGPWDNPVSMDGTGSADRFVAPTGLAVDRVGNLYVADYTGRNVRKVTPAGVVTTLAGLARTPGSQDGKGRAARFTLPWGVAVDRSGNVYVSDSGNNTIRKISPVGEVTTLAGEAGHADGSADGTGAEARFHEPRGLAVDGAGNVYVADYMNDTIRKITPEGVVTTLAGKVKSSSKVTPTHRMSADDGPVATALFNKPTGVAIDQEGNLFVTDSYNRTIRKITPDGMVTTLAGRAGYGFNVLGQVKPYYQGKPASTEAPAAVPNPDGSGTGSDALFGLPTGLAVDAAGAVYVVDEPPYTVRKGVPAAPGQN